MLFCLSGAVSCREVCVKVDSRAPLLMAILTIVGRACVAVVPGGDIPSACVTIIPVIVMLGCV